MILGFASSSCEPDDICDPTTPTTPRMLIEFYDKTNPSIRKNVNDLKVIGENQEEGVILSPSATGDDRYVTSGNSILLPLNTEKDTVKYEFINYSKSKNPLLLNTDNIEFRYTRENFYVSRACGFKTVFTLAKTDPFTLEDTTPADELWISYVIVAQKNITYENETIIKILF